MIEIPEEIFTQILTCIGAPFVIEKDLEITYDQIKEILLKPVLREYYRWFPIESYQTMAVSSSFEIPFPDNFVFSAKDVRMSTNTMNYGPVGNALVDERFIQTTGGIYGRGMYGTRNTYGHDTARISRRVEMQSFIDRNKAFKWRVLENQRKIVGFSNTQGTLEITWASFADNWDYVAFSQQQDVIKLSQSAILEYFGRLRLQAMVPDAPVELNGEMMIERGKELKEEVYSKWKNFATPVIMRG